jgi:hypothetical protein
VGNQALGAMTTDLVEAAAAFDWTTLKKKLKV